MKWITFQGKEVSTETADHQHLSNAIWFLEIFFGRQADTQGMIKELEQAIKDRFNGQILPYRPHISHSNEIDVLRQRGYLSDFNDEGIATIEYRQKIIGEIRKFPF
jgi:hypothetical protein